MVCLLAFIIVVAHWKIHKMCSAWIEKHISIVQSSKLYHSSFCLSNDMSQLLCTTSLFNYSTITTSTFLVPLIWWCERWGNISESVICPRRIHVNLVDEAGVKGSKWDIGQRPYFYCCGFVPIEAIRWQDSWGSIGLNWIGWLRGVEGFCVVNRGIWLVRNEMYPEIRNLSVQSTIIFLLTFYHS